MGNAKLDRAVYSSICSHDGITAREIAHEIGADRKAVNRCLYAYPFISDLCYHDDSFKWYGYIRQAFPHEGLGDYSGWYGFVGEFLSQSEEEWLEELRAGCKRIGRNLNDTRGLTHSFLDTRETMLALFSDLERFGVDFKSWEISFELRIRVAKWVRIYADVLVITPEAAFSLEFKMKNEINPEELAQAGKYAPYLQVVLGPDVRVTSALVLTQAQEFYTRKEIEGGGSVVVSSADMLFNVFDKELGFLG